MGPITLIWQGKEWIRINAHGIQSKAWNIQNAQEMVDVIIVVAINKKKLVAEKQSETLRISPPKSRSTLLIAPTWPCS